VVGLQLLVEVEAQDDRYSIRTTIGQLMDYRRFGDDVRLAVLLPHEDLQDDHQELLRSVCIEWIWPERCRFHDSAGGTLSR
jgi:hypothetical protein